MDKIQLFYYLLKLIHTISLSLAGWIKKLNSHIWRTGHSLPMPDLK